MEPPKENREEMFNRLLSRGEATMRELLTASFGEWPPKGLDVNEDIPHDQVVELNETFDVRDMGVAYASERKIDISSIFSRYIPDFLGGGSGVKTLGHEAVHILQFDHSIRADELFKIDLPKGHVPQDSVSRYNEMCNMLACDDVELEAKGHLSKLFNNVARSKSKFKYMSCDMEMQSHLHEVLIDGYQKWGKLPKNKGEFFAALFSSNVTQYKDIADYLSKLPKGSSARDFLNIRVKPSTASKRIMKFGKSLTSSAQKIFWNRTILMIYADLIEMYGDRPGRGRFNLGINNREVIYKKTPLKGKKEIIPVKLPWD